MQHLRDKLELLMRRQIKIKLGDAYNSEGIKMYIFKEENGEHHLIEEVGVDYFIAKHIKSNGRGTRNLFSIQHLRFIDDIPNDL